VSKFTILGRQSSGEPAESLQRIRSALGDEQPIFEQISYRADATFELDASLRAEGAEPIEYEAADDDVVEVVLGAEGEEVRRWMSVARLREEYGEAGTRGAGDGALLSARLRSDGGATRGAVKWFIKGLNFIGIDVAGAAARNSLEAVAARIEASLESGGSDRLYQLNADGPLVLTPLAAGRRRADAAPALVFLHGTFSSTRGSFGDLWRDDVAPSLREVLAGHAGRIYGFEHRSLTASPIDNALALAEQLPVGTRAQLVSHSRGGLVGEYLARACAAQAQPRILANARKVLAGADSAAQRRYHRQQVQQFEKLCEVVRARQLRVERFVRVACPANGTALASERIDDILSTLLNVMGRLGPLAESDLYYLLKAFLFALIKEKADPNVLPGIQAMNPRSRLIALLNDGAEVQGELIAIAGDTDGERLLRALLMKGVDWLFGSDNDLVVNTPSMVRGGSRAGGGAFQRAFAGRINHLGYFSDATVVDLIGKLLAGARPPEVVPIGRLLPSPGDATRGLFTRRRPVGEVSGQKPLVYVVPGVLGSHLGHAAASGSGYHRIWLDFSDIMFGRFTDLRLDSGLNIRATDVFDGAYGDLMEHLAQTHDVLPFPYDWRLSLREEALRLAHRVRQDSALAPGQPVRFVAHSMGGLLVRALMTFDDDNGGVWGEICRNPGARFLMLGTPTRGSYSAVEILLSREDMVRKLAAVDLVNGIDAIQDMARRFPGVLQLLPRPERGNDFHDPAFWAALHAADAHRESWRVPEAGELLAASDFHARLQREEDGGLPHAERISYIAGKADETPVRHVIDPQHPDGVVIRSTPEGDGRVPWETGIPAGVRTYYVNAVHGDLADTPETFAAIGEILEQGRTERLPRFPSATRGIAATQEKERRISDRVLFPDATDLADAALGRSRAVARRASRPPVRVTIRHGDLRFTRGIVVVGHYQGDTIISAEHVLDQALGGTMRRASDLGVYPGAPGSGKYFPNRRSGRPEGALVVGLGYVGELTPRRLRRNLRDALIALALELAESTSPGTVIEPHITPLLIGTGAGGIAASRSVESILGGVRDANAALETHAGKKDGAIRVHFGSVEFLDLFADRALDAAHALERLAGSARYAERFDIVPIVEQGEGGVNRASYAESAGWWQRLQVVEDEGALEYSLLTDRSLVPQRLVFTDAGQVDRLAGAFEADIGAASGRGKTLYEMLLPAEFKAQVPDQEGVVMMLNPAAARHPWEMLDERSVEQRRGERRPGNGHDEPLAVRVGLLRQLKLDIYPPLAPRMRDRVALVVGDPPLHGLLPQLPGAAAEARNVAGLLTRHEILTTELVGRRSDAVFDALFDRPYQVLHLAGHGVCELDAHGAVLRAGMVMGEGIQFDSHDVRQLPGVPDLVFINCCHLGRIHATERGSLGEQYFARRSLFASNLAMAFIERGARAVVAAGWEVSDHAAEAFAGAFYEQMLGGATFGAAVLAARRAAFTAEPHLNTWGAYQCYGEQDFRFDPTAGDGGTRAVPRPLSLAEAYAQLERLRRSASRQDADTAALRERIGAFINAIPRAWAEDARLHAAAGRAYGAVSDLARAIEQLELARELESASCTLEDLQQLANYKSRLAARLLEAGTQSSGQRRRARSLLREAQHEIECLLEFGETVERLSLLGSVHKRRIQSSAGQKPSARDLSAMIRAYWRAYERSLQHDRPDPYPLGNAVSGLLVSAWAGIGVRRAEHTWPEDLGLLAERLGETLARAQPQEGIWAELAVLDAAVLRHLIDESLAGPVRGRGGAARWEALAADYRAVLDKADPVQADSALNQLAFLQHALASVSRTRAARFATRRACVAALEQLHDRLAGTAETDQD
jgi:hypothetical protein